MAKWLRVDCLVAQHPRMVKAGPFGMAVAKALWELAKLHDHDDGDVTVFWDEYVLARQTLFDKLGPAGYAIVRTGMQEAIKAGLVVCTRRARTEHAMDITVTVDGSNLTTTIQTPTETVQLACSPRTSRRSKLTLRVLTTTESDHISIRDWDQYQRSTEPTEPDRTPGAASAIERKRLQRQREKSGESSPSTGRPRKQVSPKKRDMSPPAENVTNVTNVTGNVTLSRLSPLTGTGTGTGTVRDKNKDRRGGDPSDDVTFQNVTNVTNVTPENVTPPALPEQFSKLIHELIGEAHPESKLPAERSSILQAEWQVQHAGVDLEYATQVARWAFHSGQTWKDGASWRQVLQSPEMFWAKFDKISKQYDGRKDGQRRSMAEGDNGVSVDWGSRLQAAVQRGTEEVKDE